MKVFTDHTVILAVSITGTSISSLLPSGNVYAKETIDELNKQPKNWKDLLTGTPFPLNLTPQRRTFHHQRPYHPPRPRQHPKQTSLGV
jgi:hypothetical protein